MKSAVSNCGVRVGVSFLMFLCAAAALVAMAFDNWYLSTAFYAAALVFSILSSWIERGILQGRFAESQEARNHLLDMVDAEQNKRDALLDKLVKTQGELTRTENEVYQANRQRKNYEVRCGDLGQKVADAEKRLGEAEHERDQKLKAFTVMVNTADRLKTRLAEAESREAQYLGALMLSLGSVEREGLAKVVAKVKGLLGKRNIHEVELKPGDKFQIPSRGIISKCCEGGPATYEYIDDGVVRDRAMRCLKCRRETPFRNTLIQRVVLV